MDHPINDKREMIPTERKDILTMTICFFIECIALRSGKSVVRHIPGRGGVRVGHINSRELTCNQAPHSFAAGGIGKSPSSRGRGR